MPVSRLPIGTYVRIERPQLQVVLDRLRQLGFRTVGPRVVDEAVVYRDLESVDQLPVGVIDDQEGGKYRLKQTNHDGWFHYTNGPDSLKKFLFPPRETLLEAHRSNDKWSFQAPDGPPQPLAVIGVRGCDLRALEIQDQVFLRGPYVDQAYKRRRESLFVVAVNCIRTVPTCFCHSMKCGPGVTGGFDLALTELDRSFVVAVGSSQGGEVIAATQWAPCTLDQVERAKRVTAQLTEEMNARNLPDDSGSNDGSKSRSLDTTDLHDLLLSRLDHPRWKQVAERCLACANCTMVCPTCFCSAVEEVSDLAGDHVERQRTWDSCFTAEHSYMNTGAVRKTTASRYRQWLVHKLATWQDQFGVSGCVGCGRCITWCPVGIDLTEEVAALRGDAK
jgi:ferredoxin